MLRATFGAGPTLIDQGVLTGVVSDQRRAGLTGGVPTGHAVPDGWRFGGDPVPSHLLLEAGESTEDELLAECGSGLVVNRLDYLRVLHPKETLVTGTTRDATYWAEDGKLVAWHPQLRFTFRMDDVMNAILGVGAVRERVRPDLHGERRRTVAADRRRSARPPLNQQRPGPCVLIDGAGRCCSTPDRVPVARRGPMTPTLTTLLNGYSLPPTRAIRPSAPSTWSRATPGGCCSTAAMPAGAGCCWRHCPRAASSPADIDTVVLSHGHWDHLQNVDFFRQPGCCCMRTNCATWTRHPPRTSARRRWARQSSTGWTSRRRARATSSSPGVQVLELPGPHPWSIGLAVTTDAGTAVLTGDAVPTAGVLRARARVGSPVRRRPGGCVGRAGRRSSPMSSHPDTTSLPASAPCGEVAMNLITGTDGEPGRGTTEVDLATAAEFLRTALRDRRRVARRCGASAT